MLDIIPLISKKSYYYHTLVHDAAILEELPEAVKKIKQQQHEIRCWISRVLLRKNLPSDLVPTITAFAVNGSKIWDYM